jgi:hypothetical protein
MSGDIFIAKSNTSNFDKLPTKVIPYYLVELEQEFAGNPPKKNKKVKCFISSKLEFIENCIKCIGFYYEGETTDLHERVSEVYTSTDKTNILEI